MDRRLWLIPIGLALLLLAAIAVVFGPRLLGGRGAALQSIPAFSGTAESGGILGEAEGLPEPGETAPDFALPDLAGETVQLSDLGGRPVVLNFWATWCAPCRLEMPMLEQAAADGGDALAVLTINQGETAEQVSAFFDEVGLSLPALLDSDSEVGRAYGAVYLPSTFIIGPDGIVSAVHHGILSREELDGYLAALAEAGQETAQ
ncbi:MAG: TlpA family protein disulfide reductase [Anaerolineae bacterium]|nr:TlpA family protein disulfide reductase [Anaerolineae bacterium]